MRMADGRLTRWDGCVVLLWVELLGWEGVEWVRMARVVGCRDMIAKGGWEMKRAMKDP